eukprot:scaffold978_cov392-Prasinococcus_capsulatus_cf.AAC.15
MLGGAGRPHSAGRAEPAAPQVRTQQDVGWACPRDLRQSTARVDGTSDDTRHAHAQARAGAGASVRRVSRVRARRGVTWHSLSRLRPADSTQRLLGDADAAGGVSALRCVCVQSLARGNRVVGRLEGRCGCCHTPWSSGCLSRRAVGRGARPSRIGLAGRTTWTERVRLTCFRPLPAALSYAAACSTPDAE